MDARNLNYCQPSADRARALRRHMEEGLWGSVAVVLTGALPDDSLDGGFRAGLTGPLDFGTYFDLALGFPDGSAAPEPLAAAARATLAERYADVTRTCDDADAPLRRPRVSTLSADVFSPDDLARLSRWWDIEPENALNLAAPDPAEAAAARARIATAFDHMRAAAPELHDEICHLVSDIVLAGQDGSQSIDFGGITSFCLWGAAALSASSNDSWPRVYQTIVHEAAHNLLFAHARDEPLIEGGGMERSLSPLRRSQRPMDGIYHAAFVSAREALALDLLLVHHEKTPCLSDQEAAEVARLLDESVLSFTDCAGVVRREASPTALGEAILADCEMLMRGAFAVVDEA